MIDSLTARQWFMHTRHAVIGMGQGKEDNAPLPELGVSPHEAHTTRVGILAGDEAMWETAAEHVAVHFGKDARLTAPPAWETDDGDCDCILLLGWPAASDRRRLKQIELHCRGGVALVALRTLHAEMPGWPDFVEEVFGGRQADSRRTKLMEVQRSGVAWHHPVLEGVENLIAEGEVYRGPRLSPLATILLAADDGRGLGPVAWTTRHERGRVVCSTLGHDDDFRDRAFLRFLSNAVHWAAQGLH